jgi:hypothetical protein
MSTLKTNLSRAEEILDEWTTVPLIIRNPKPITAEAFNTSHKAHIKERFKHVKEGGTAIHHVLKESNKKLKISSNHPDWNAYVDFANNVVTDGLANLVVKSLDTLLQTVSTGADEEIVADDEEDLFGDKKKEGSSSSSFKNYFKSQAGPSRICAECI